MRERRDGARHMREQVLVHLLHDGLEHLARVWVRVRVRVWVRVWVWVRVRDRVRVRVRVRFGVRVRARVRVRANLATHGREDERATCRARVRRPRRYTGAAVALGGGGGRPSSRGRK